MSLRCVLVSLVLGSVLFAADQTPVPAKPESAPAAKPDEAKSSSRPHIRFGGFSFGAGYSYFSGGYPYYGYYPDYWAYSPFYHPFYYTGFLYQPGMGNVKIQSPDKTSMVYLDGALAGRLDKLKDMWLTPGVYQLEVRDSSRRMTQKIYVLSGKTLRVTPEMMVSEALQ